MELCDVSARRLMAEDLKVVLQEVYSVAHLDSNTAMLNL
jgi:hypothetical protein